MYSIIEGDKKTKKSDFKGLIMKISVLLKKETVSKPCNEVTNNISFQNGNSIQSVNYSKEIIIPPYILHKRVKPLIYSTDYIIEDVIEINVLKKNSHWSLKSINLVTNELSKDYNLKHFISNYFKEANNIDYYFGKSDEKLSTMSS